MNVQFIEQNGKKQYAVIPVESYTALLEKAEMLDDIHAFDAALVADEELIPGEVVERILNSENKIKVWREYRQLTQMTLSKQCGMAQASIAQMERGQRMGSVTVLKKIAGVLKVDVDDLI